VNILVAEDTPSLRALIQLCLERAGHKVDLTANGQEALDLFIAGSYETAILDIQMPVMNGLEAVKLMRDWEKKQDRSPIPILALTANTERADLRKCIESGFTATVRKPFGREDILAAVAPAAPQDRITVQADPEFADLIPLFLDNCRSHVLQMKKSLASGDFPSIAAVSHQIIGAGASYGFKPLSEESRLIEAAAKNGDGADAREHLEALSTYLKRLNVVYPDG
jgi:CheY-like chemotaxis protein